MGWTLRHMFWSFAAAAVVGAGPGAGPAPAQDAGFALNAPEELVETGFLNYLLPRFSLKTSIRIRLVDETGDAAFGSDGVPVFRADDTVWHFAATQGAQTDRFLDWLSSDVGRRTIDAFKSDGGPVFSSDVAVQTVAVTAEMSGDAKLGEEVALTACGRCHVVSEKNRMTGIGSSPSFRLLRGFEDWQGRFEAFYTLKPHAAFTQITDVTEPFDPERPSPMVPIELTIEEIDAVLAYVSTLEPADLGAPIQTQ